MFQIQSVFNGISPTTKKQILVLLIVIVICRERIYDFGVASGEYITQALHLSQTIVNYSKKMIETTISIVFFLFNASVLLAIVGAVVFVYKRIVDCTKQVGKLKKKVSNVYKNM